MKKVIYPLSVVAPLLFASQAFAQASGGGVNSGNICPPGMFNYLCSLTLGNFVAGLVTLVFVVAGIIALFYLIWGGIKWLISGGDKSNIETAQGHIVASIIGLVIIFVSFVVLNIIWNFFFHTSLTNIVLPSINGGNAQF